MENIKEYLISIVATAIICSIIMCVVGSKGTNSAVIRMLCGLFMAITVLTPLLRLEAADYSRWFANLQTDGEEVTQWGKTSAREATAQIIIENTEAYILDKASSIGLSIEVEVVLSEEDVQKPIGVKIFGDASPYARRQLQHWIYDSLGIPEGNQTWM